MIPLSLLSAASSAGHFIFSNAATIIAIVTLIITMAAVAGATFRNTRNSTTLGNLQAAAASWEKKSVAQESEIKELQDQLASKEHEISELRGRVNALQDMVTGRADIESLTQVVRDLAERTDVKVGEVLSQIGEARSEIKVVSGVLSNPGPITQRTA